MEHHFQSIQLYYSSTIYCMHIVMLCVIALDNYHGITQNTVLQNGFLHPIFPGIHIKGVKALNNC